MRIIGAEGLTAEQQSRDVENGARIVVYSYCVSILILTFRRSSDIYLIRPGQSRIKPGLGFSLLSFVVGWWGLPWGIIYTIGALVTNFRGGKDVTDAVLAALNAPAVAPGASDPAFSSPPAAGPRNPW